MNSIKGDCKWDCWGKKIQIESKIEVSEVFEMLKEIGGKSWEGCHGNKTLFWRDTRKRRKMRRDCKIRLNLLLSNCISSFVSWLFSGHWRNSKKCSWKYPHLRRIKNYIDKVRKFLLVEAKLEMFQFLNFLVQSLHENLSGILRDINSFIIA